MVPYVVSRITSVKPWKFIFFFYDFLTKYLLPFSKSEFVIEVNLKPTNSIPPPTKHVFTTLAPSFSCPLYSLPGWLRFAPLITTHLLCIHHHPTWSTSTLVNSSIKACSFSPWFVILLLRLCGELSSRLSEGFRFSSLWWYQIRILWGFFVLLCCLTWILLHPLWLFVLHR